MTASVSQQAVAPTNQLITQLLLLMRLKPRWLPYYNRFMPATHKTTARITGWCQPITRQRALTHICPLFWIHQPGRMYYNRFMPATVLCLLPIQKQTQYGFNWQRDITWQPLSLGGQYLHWHPSKFLQKFSSFIWNRNENHSHAGIP